MKKFFFVVCLTVSISSYGQNAFAIFQFNEAAEQISWTLTDQETGEVVVEMSNVPFGMVHVYPLDFESGGYVLQITDAGGNGWLYGFFTIIKCNGEPIYSETGPIMFPSSGSTIGINDLWSCCPESDSCEEVDEVDCPSDLNNDGVVGVADLLIFISDFGMICP